LRLGEGWKAVSTFLTLLHVIPLLLSLTSELSMIVHTSSGSQLIDDLESPPENGIVRLSSSLLHVNEEIIISNIYKWLISGVQV
jgi:hypothetical protein